MLNGKNQKKLALIGLDGVSFELLKELTHCGVMPNLGKLIKSKGLVRTTAPLPEISPVSWTSLMTGMNPGQHSVFGFAELDPVNYSYILPHFPSLPVKPLWEELDGDYTSIIINLPHTYPARPLKGILVSGFVAIELEKAVYPQRILPILKQMNYIFDPNFSLIPDKKKEFLRELEQILATRYGFFQQVSKENWNLLVFVITETDRINHFFYHSLSHQDSPFHKDFLLFYKKVDDMVGEIIFQFDKKGIPFVVVSDHGFVPLKKEIYLAQYLKEWGYLFLDSPEDNPTDLTAMSPRTTVFALDPSRIYLHLKEKYKRGCVYKNEYNKLREEIKNRFLELEFHNQRILTNVFFKEEIYWGKFLEKAPDMVLLANEGFDLKLGLSKKGKTGVSNFEGMHSRHNAILVDGCGFHLKDDTPIYAIGKEIKKFFRNS
ncbi:MAG: alkaline phosphatase family protein [Candidatus Aminicenantes bacterium]|nr:MAG: alkaline phosphatase family protein [Candidatus Aminicenantes bacterium]